MTTMPVHAQLSLSPWNEASETTLLDKFETTSLLSSLQTPWHESLELPNSSSKVSFVSGILGVDSSVSNCPLLLRAFSGLFELSEHSPIRLVDIFSIWGRKGRSQRRTGRRDERIRRRPARTKAKGAGGQAQQLLRDIRGVDGGGQRLRRHASF